MLTGSQLERLLHYDPDSGIWTWAEHYSIRPRHRGQEAGHVRPDGYRKIRIGGIAYYTGRLAVLWMTGNWPDEEVDHKDRDPSNDKWDNLRPATSSQNKYNRDMGYKLRGVYPCGAKWQVQVGGIYFGLFDHCNEAIAYRDSMAVTMAGEFAFLNQQGTSL